LPMDFFFLSTISPHLVLASFLPSISPCSPWPQNCDSDVISSIPELGFFFFFLFLFWLCFVCFGFCYMLCLFVWALVCMFMVNFWRFSGLFVVLLYVSVHV
jgi:hypothetical protein